MPPKKRNLPRNAHAKKQQQALLSNSDELEEDDLSSESSGESEMSMFKPSGQPELDDSGNEDDEGARNEEQDDEGARNEQQEAQKNDGNDNAEYGEEDASPPDIHKDHHEYKNDKQVIVSVHFGRT